MGLCLAGLAFVPSLAANAELRSELESRAEWARRVEAELEERTHWALDLEKEKNEALEDFKRAQETIARLEQEIRAAHAALARLGVTIWTRLGRKLGILKP